MWKGMSSLLKGLSVAAETIFNSFWFQSPGCFLTKFSTAVLKRKYLFTKQNKIKEEKEFSALSLAAVDQAFSFP